MGYESVRIVDGFYSIEDKGVRCFLFEGENSALLIDTAFGREDIASFVKTLTDKEITVVNTHADPDHIGGNAAFKKVMMHPSDFHLYLKEAGKFAPPEPLWENDIIDIGSFCFRVILIPGHTPGSIALLEENKRFLIAGDSVQSGAIFMFGEGRDMHAYIASMEKLQALAPSFEHVYSSHGSLTTDKNSIKERIADAKKVLSGEIIGYDPSEKLGRKMNCLFYPSECGGFLYR